MIFRTCAVKLENALLYSEIALYNHQQQRGMAQLALSTIQNEQKKNEKEVFGILEEE